jgi:hypothetical protein
MDSSAACPKSLVADRPSNRPARRFPMRVLGRKRRSGQSVHGLRAGADRLYGRARSPGPSCQRPGIRPPMEPPMQPHRFSGPTLRNMVRARGGHMLAAGHFPSFTVRDRFLGWPRKAPFTSA